MVKYLLGAAFYIREGVHHAQMRRLDTETPMDENPSVLRPDGFSSIVVKETVFMSLVS
tara:strand:- start:2147 stop:2320 length:174 start_codon:yes stop_codon:yes gene_type:complete